MFILLLFLLVGCHDATRVASPIPPRLSIYGGNNQVAFDTISRLHVPFSVRVVDADGRPVPAIRVQWRVIAGSGELTAYPGGERLTDNITATGSDGVAAVSFRSRSLGNGIVSASVTGAASVEFHIVTDPTLAPPDVIITGGPFFDCTGGTDPTRYWVSSGSGIRDTVLSAVVGDRVGIRYADYLLPVCTARFKSTSVPAGGTPFDSGVIHAGDMFEFKPDAVGNWTFTDAINGGSGTLIVRPPS
jgi:hypothetical protein